MADRAMLEGWEQFHYAYTDGDFITLMDWKNRVIGCDGEIADTNWDAYM